MARCARLARDRRTAADDSDQPCWVPRIRLAGTSGWRRLQPGRESSGVPLPILVSSVGSELCAIPVTRGMASRRGTTLTCPGGPADSGIPHDAAISRCRARPPIRMLEATEVMSRPRLPVSTRPRNAPPPARTSCQLAEAAKTAARRRRLRRSARTHHQRSRHRARRTRRSATTSAPSGPPDTPRPLPLAWRCHSQPGAPRPGRRSQPAGDRPPTPAPPLLTPPRPRGDGQRRDSSSHDHEEILREAHPAAQLNFTGVRVIVRVSTVSIACRVRGSADRRRDSGQSGQQQRLVTAGGRPGHGWRPAGRRSRATR